MRKVAVFIHGWMAEGDIWDSIWSKKQRLIRLFRELDYEIVKLDMPDKYSKEVEGFDYYAKYIAEELEKLDVCSSCHRQGYPPNEIVIIAHSMGGIASRLYLQRGDIGNLKIKARVTKLITLASPHHGTSPLLEEILSDIFFPPGTSMFHWSKCYHQLAIGSKFVKMLNEKSLPSTVKMYSIWTKGDEISNPTHSAVCDLADNYLIDTRSVNHVGTIDSIYTLNIVRKIMDNSFVPSGLQNYPNKCSCNKGQWVPIFYYKNEIDSIKNLPLFLKRILMPFATFSKFDSFEKEYLWKCKNIFNNKGCHESHVSKWKPGAFGCEIGLMKQRFHRWEMTGIKRWKCDKCNKEYIGIRRPKSYRRNSCSHPFKDWHRWMLKEYEWKCVECKQRKRSFWMPHLLGCSVGIYHEKRFHNWRKAEKRYIFRFMCTNCKKIVEK